MKTYAKSVKPLEIYDLEAFVNMPVYQSILSKEHQANVLSFGIISQFFMAFFPQSCDTYSSRLYLLKFKFFARPKADIGATVCLIPPSN